IGVWIIGLGEYPLSRESSERERACTQQQRSIACGLHAVLPCSFLGANGHSRDTGSTASRLMRRLRFRRSACSPAPRLHQFRDLAEGLGTLFSKTREALLNPG